MITIVASAKEKIIPYGVCNLSPDGKLKNIKEKPKFSFLAISGIYCVNPKILKFVPKNKKFDFPDLISTVRNKKLKDVLICQVVEKKFHHCLKEKINFHKVRMN